MHIRVNREERRQFAFGDAFRSLLSERRSRAKDRRQDWGTKFHPAVIPGAAGHAKDRFRLRFFVSLSACRLRSLRPCTVLLFSYRRSLPPRSFSFGAALFQYRRGAAELPAAEWAARSPGDSEDYWRDSASGRYQSPAGGNLRRLDDCRPDGGDTFRRKGCQ